MAGISMSASASGLDGVQNRLKRMRNLIHGGTDGVVNTAMDRGAARLKAATPLGLRAYTDRYGSHPGIAKGGWRVLRAQGGVGHLRTEIDYVQYLIDPRYRAARPILVNAWKALPGYLREEARRAGLDLVTTAKGA